MAAATPVAAALKAHCPLCGAPILSIGSSGRVEAEELHAIPLFNSRRAGEGYMLCAECGVLADLPTDLLLN